MIKNYIILNMKINKKPFKRCPRCDNKCIQTATKCNECGLIFSRLDYATNKAAKEMMKKDDRDYILYTSTLPKDISYTKLLLYTLFLGLFGGHYYYVGKYVKGILMSAMMVYTIVCVIFNVYLVEALSVLYVPIGIGVLAWMVSCVYVICKKFKVPVCIETTETGGFKV